MARSTFVRTGAAWMFQRHKLGSMFIPSLSSGRITFWDAPVGGNKHTDLIDHVGNLVSDLPVDADGFFPQSWQGPDGVTSMWADGGTGVRILVLSMDLLLDAGAQAVAAALSADEAQAAAASVQREQPGGVAGLGPDGLLYESRIPDLPYADASIAPEGGKQAVGKGEIVVSVRDHGAVGDGVTNDLPAFNAAMTASNGGTVLVPSGVYGLGGTLAPQAGVTIQGQGDPTLKAVGASRTFMILASAAGSTVTGLTLDKGGVTVTAAWNTLAAGCSITDCTVIDPSAATLTDGQVGIQVGAGAVDTLIEGNTIDGMGGSSISLNYSHTRTTVRNNRIRNWRLRGIYVIGDATRSSTGLTIEGNRITDMVAGGSSRYPVQIAGNDSAPHRNVRVKGNIVIGPGKAYTAADPGTADGFGLFHIEDFEVVGNISTDGGDGGITIHSQSSRGVVSGNICLRNNAVGIYIGAYTDTYTRAITVTGNTCMNNGQYRDPNATILDRARSGIWVWGGSDIAISGNVLGDDQATKTQQYGVAFIEANNVKCGPDTDAGNAQKLYHLDGTANTNINQVSMTPVA